LLDEAVFDWCAFLVDVVVVLDGHVEFVVAEVVVVVNGSTLLVFGAVVDDALSLPPLLLLLTVALMPVGVELLEVDDDDVGTVGASFLVRSLLPLTLLGGLLFLEGADLLLLAMVALLVVVVVVGGALDGFVLLLATATRCPPATEVEGGVLMLMEVL
jgi:hypothetical protein